MQTTQSLLASAERAPFSVGLLARPFPMFPTPSGARPPTTEISPRKPGSHPEGRVAPLPHRLDTLVQSAHRLRLFGRSYHPYLLMTDLALLATIVSTWAFGRAFSALSPLRFLAEFALLYLAYELIYLPAKRALTGVRARSASIDFIAFVIPAHALLSWAFAIPVPAALDLLAVILPTFMVFARLGCFLGGCCHGRPWRHGVLYRPDVVRAVDGWRRFRPAPPAGTRVFPIQLLDGAANLILAVAVWVSLVQAGGPSGRGLLLYLGGYAVARFLLDFARRSSVCPRVGPFSFAQAVSLPLAIGCGLAFWWIRA